MKKRNFDWCHSWDRPN